MKHTAAVITVSDKGYRGERTDTSGPNLCEILKAKDFDVVYTSVVPDEIALIQRELLKCADELGVALALTTGGTGFSPRDITPEATMQIVERLTPGIPEVMRAESMRSTPKGCLSRGVAGIRNRTLIINLPGSRKASEENILAVIDPMRHGVEILQGEGSADCAVSEKSGMRVSAEKRAPSMDAWLREAKAHESAPNVGMYLTHNGVVRETARARVRQGVENAEAVTGMEFSCDRAKLDAVIADTYRMEGICYIRVWVNEGRLRVGDDIMYVLIGGDIRPHVLAGLQYLVGRIKTECVKETELYGSSEEESHA